MLGQGVQRAALCGVKNIQRGFPNKRQVEAHMQDRGITLESEREDALDRMERDLFGPALALCMALVAVVVSILGALAWVIQR